METKTENSFIVRGVKFTLSDNGELLYNNSSRPSFLRLFKLFNPQITNVHTKKSDFSSKVFVIGFCDYFQTYYFTSGIEKVRFQSVKEASNYVKRFLKLKYATSNKDNLIWFIGRKKIPYHVFQHFIDLFGFEHKINDYITLKLEKKQFNIYVKGKLFRQCKFLLFNLDPAHADKYADLRSLDEAKEILDRTNETESAGKFRIGYMTEFWGHVSNLQTWSEYDYDTRLLDKSLAFPLLRELARAGDERAIKISKEEIAERFEKGIDSTRMYLINQGHLKDFSKDELETLFRSVGKRYDNDEFWVSTSFSELLERFNDIDSKTAVFVRCETHDSISNVYGRIDPEVLYLNCGCELSKKNSPSELEACVIEVFKK